MADTRLPASEYIKQGIFILVILGLALFGIKSCRKYQKKRDVVIELTSYTSDSSAYEQFYAGDARGTLLKAMHQMHLAAELGHTPVEILEEVMEESKGLLDAEDKADLPLRKQIVRDALLNNYENCRKLGVFSDPNNMLKLERGELPVISGGPSEGEEAVITTIIPASLLDGVDKLVPNLVIGPPAEEDGKPGTGKPNEFEIARAKSFAKSLAEADLIENDAYKKIIRHFDSLKSPQAEPATP